MSTPLDGNTQLQRALNSWKETRSHTLDLLESLTDEDLTVEFPRPVFDTIGKHLQELGVIQKAYINAIRTNHIDYAEMMFEFDPSIITSKVTLRRFLEEADSELWLVLEESADPFQQIDWGLPSNPTLIEHIYWMSQHEVLHHGQLAAYCYLHNIDLPQSWVDAWAFPPKDPEIVRRWLASHEE